MKQTESRIFHIGTRDDRNQIGSLAAKVKHTMPNRSLPPDGHGYPHAEGLTGRFGWNGTSRWRFQMQHHQAEGDWLFIDTDVLIHQDVQDVFENDDPFDIVIASRVKGDGAHGPAFVEMPHNMGVVFSRSPVFWKAVEAELLTRQAETGMDGRPIGGVQID